MTVPNTENIEARLCDYIEGNLDEAGRLEIEKHLQAHPHHRKLIAELAQTRDMVRELPHVGAPPEILEAVEAHMERNQLLGLTGENNRLAMIGRRSAFPRMFAAAAMVTLTAGLGAVVYLVLRTQPPHFVEAPSIAMATEPSAAAAKSDARDADADNDQTAAANDLTQQAAQKATASRQSFAMNMTAPNMTGPRMAPAMPNAGAAAPSGATAGNASAPSNGTATFDASAPAPAVEATPACVLVISSADPATAGGRVVQSLLANNIPFTAAADLKFVPPDHGDLGVVNNSAIPDRVAGAIGAAPTTQSVVTLQGGGATASAGASPAIASQAGKTPQNNPALLANQHGATAASPATQSLAYTADRAAGPVQSIHSQFTAANLKPAQIAQILSSFVAASQKDKVTVVNAPPEVSASVPPSASLSFIHVGESAQMLSSAATTAPSNGEASTPAMSMNGRPANANVFGSAMARANASGDSNAVAPAATEPTDAATAATRPIHAGDSLSINVADIPSLSGSTPVLDMKVAGDGTISLPKIGAIEAADRTPDQLRDAIVAAYQQRDPGHPGDVLITVHPVLANEQQSPATQPTDAESNSAAVNGNDDMQQSANVSQMQQQLSPAQAPIPEAALAASPASTTQPAVAQIPTTQSIVDAMQLGPQPTKSAAAASEAPRDLVIIVEQAAAAPSSQPALPGNP